MSEHYREGTLVRVLRNGAREVRRALQDWALRGTPLVTSFDFRPEESSAGLSGELVLHTQRRTIRNSRLILIENPGSPLRFIDATVTGGRVRVRHGERTQWHFDLPDQEGESQVRLTYRLEHQNSPLDFPSHFPYQLTRSSESVPLAAMQAASSGSSLRVSGVAPAGTLGNSWTAATLTHESVLGRAALLGSEIRVILAGDEWSGIPEARRQQLVHTYSASAHYLTGLLGGRPRGDIQLRLRPRGKERLSPTGATHELDESLVDDSSEAATVQRIVLEKLCSLWWGGCSRIVGWRAFELTTAVRRAVGLDWLAASGNLESHARAETRYRQLASDTAGSSGGIGPADASIAGTFALSLELSNWLGRTHGSRDELRRLTSEMWGMQVPSSWLVDQLAVAGVKVPTELR